MNYNLPVIVLAVLCIIMLSVLLTNKSKEGFSGGSGASTVCSFQPNNQESKDECLARCISETADLTNNDEKASCLDSSTGCVNICEQATPNPCVIPAPGGNTVTKCIINNHMLIRMP